MKLLLFLLQNILILEELYSMPWYRLRSIHQLEVCSVMHWYQNGMRFTIGPFDELNFETASDVSGNFAKMKYKSFNLNRLSVE